MSVQSFDNWIDDALVPFRPQRKTILCQFAGPQTLFKKMHTICGLRPRPSFYSGNLYAGKTAFSYWTGSHSSCQCYFRVKAQGVKFNFRAFLCQHRVLHNAYMLQGTLGLLGLKGRVAHDGTLRTASHNSTPGCYIKRITASHSSGQDGSHYGDDVFKFASLYFIWIFYFNLLQMTKLTCQYR